MISIRQQVSLRDFSTMKLGGEAAYMCEVSNRFDVPKAIEWADEHKLPYIMVGGGSNIVWKDTGFAGLVIVNRIKGIEKTSEDDENLYLTVGAGEVWDNVVSVSVDSGFCDLAPLSLIPGTAGATPIQNVGAYGTDIAHSLVTVEAWDTQIKTFVTIPGFECEFGYRTSRFKTTEAGRFFITGITLHLTSKHLEPPFYAALDHYFVEHGIKKYTGDVVRQSVIALRSLRLPDPSQVPNCGSFFGNPIVDEIKLNDLLLDHPDLRYWKQPDGSVKLGAGWLIEHSGFKGFHDKETGMATWDHHALVLVNEHASTTSQLEAFMTRIQTAVLQQFGVSLIPEPQILPHSNIAG